MNGEDVVGSFVWHDLVTAAPSRALEFYSRLLGWDPVEWSGGDIPSAMLANRGRCVAGVVPVHDGLLDGVELPCWMPYVAVPDADATASRAGELGGRVIHPPTEIPAVGRFSILADLQGAVIAVFAAAEDTPRPSAAEELGDFVWHELATDDPEMALFFYSELFGWRALATASSAASGRGLVVSTDDRRNGGILVTPPRWSAAAHWLCCASVAELDATVAVATGLGARVLSECEEVADGVRLACCRDPQGAAFGLVTVR